MWVMEGQGNRGPLEGTHPDGGGAATGRGGRTSCVEAKGQEGLVPQEPQTFKPGPEDSTPRQWLAPNLDEDAF